MSAESVLLLSISLFHWMDDSWVGEVTLFSVYYILIVRSHFSVNYLEIIQK